MQLKNQTFNDGALKLYEVKNIAEDGNMPKDGLVLKYQDGIRYEERTVGISRFWTAQQFNSTIERVLRIQRVPDVNRSYIVIPNDGQQYTIKQIQLIKDVMPVCYDLSLERVDADYDIK